MNGIKKAGIIFGTVLLLAGISGCSSSTEDNIQKQSEEKITTQEKKDKSETEQETSDEERNILVAYFSCTGTTKKAAEYASDILGADLYEITSAEAYTAEDLDYNDDNSRTSIEQNDDTARPQINGSAENMDGYNIILLGYPIWWGKAPRIISTFVESYDFDGKIIVPFCTSGGSGFGSSGEELQKLCTDNATWKEGTRFGSDVTREAVEEWIDGLEVEGKE